MNRGSVLIEAGTPGYGSVFAVGEFRAVFAAHVLSMLGTVLAGVSLAVLVFHRTGSPLLTALVFALGFLPYALSGVLLSGVADRYPPRRVLVACDLLSVACLGVMALRVTPLLAAGGALAEWLPPYAVVGGAGVLGTVGVFGAVRAVRRTRQAVAPA